MSLEATVIIVDNSEWSRNGDFQPSRFMSQVEAVTTITRHKVQVNVENVVGLVDLTGPTCHMTLVSSRDISKLIGYLHRMKISGSANLSGSIQVAQLALKHRQNKRQSQRVICFVASPVSESELALKRLGLRLKKNNVAVDVISFGENEVNSLKLKAFVEAVNKDGNSRYLEIMTEGDTLIKMLQKNSFFGESDVMAARDEYDDDVMAMVMRMSLQEAQNNGNAYQDENAMNNTAVIADHRPMNDVRLEGEFGNLLGMNGQSMGVEYDPDPELAEALRLSLQESLQFSSLANANTSQGGGNQQGSSENPAPMQQEYAQMEIEFNSSDPEIMQALMLSLQGNEGHSHVDGDAGVAMRDEQDASFKNDESQSNTDTSNPTFKNQSDQNQKDQKN